MLKRAARAVLTVALIIPAAAPSMAQKPAAAPPQADYLEQGWSEADKEKWYTISQGSRLLPLAWIQALEQAGENEKFLSEANVLKFGYLPNPASKEGLPLGFVADVGPSPDLDPAPWAGMTCAACHTGEITYGAQHFRVEGAPTLADFQTFMESLRASLAATRDEAGKLDRFTTAVLGANATPEEKAKLAGELDKQILWYTRLEEKNASPMRYGHGRLDAQGHILNKLSLVIGVEDQIKDYPSDAPASYPFLWNTPQHDKVQWNGLAPQPSFFVDEFNGKPYNIGAIFRNIIEVSGVFASIDTKQYVNADGYSSSLRFESMIDLESLVKRLKSPRWPNAFPIDRSLAEDEGKRIYDENCKDCHAVLDPATELETEIEAKMSPLKDIGTDIWLACNVFLHESKSGDIEGRKPLLSDTPIEKVDKTILILKNILAGMYFDGRRQKPSNVPAKGLFAVRDSAAVSFDDLKPSGLAATSGVGPLVKEQRAATCLAANDEILAYKARPLNGIWATAPYLHNGSVPTLEDLLLPANDRPKSFWVGGTEFNPDKVGFKSGPGDGPFELRTHDASGKAIPGNDNGGHPYGTNLLEGQRKALIEYLKTL